MSIFGEYLEAGNMQKKKVLFVATVVKTHMMQFHIPYLKMFQEMGWETAVASRNDYENPEDCKIPYCDTYYDIPFERLPWKPKNIQSYKMLKKIIVDFLCLYGLFLDHNSSYTKCSAIDDKGFY